MKIFFTFLLCVLGLSALSQSVLSFRADTVKIFKVGGTCELVLLNTTKDTLGLAMNAGEGRITFKRPFVINDSTIVIANDTLTLRGGSTLTIDDINAAITAAVAALNLTFDTDLMDGSGTGGAPYRPDTTLYIETRWHSQYLIDSLGDVIDAIVIIGGSGGGKTNILNIGQADSVAVKINDSLWHMKTFIEGTNVTFTVTDSTITINGASGSAEVNTITTTVSGTTNLTVSMEAMIDYVLVDPATALTGFKIGTVSDDDAFFPATPVDALGADFTTFDVGAYLPSSTAVYFSGITSSTIIKIVFKPLHL